MLYMSIQADFRAFPPLGSSYTTVKYPFNHKPCFPQCRRWRLIRLQVRQDKQFRLHSDHIHVSYHKFESQVPFSESIVTNYATVHKVLASLSCTGPILVASCSQEFVKIASCSRRESKDGNLSAHYVLPPNAGCFAAFSSSLWIVTKSASPRQSFRTINQSGCVGA